MSTYLLVPGAGGSAWFWHRVTPLLEARGHTVIAPEIDMSDPALGLADYTDAIVAAADGARDVVLVAQSMAGFYGPPACARLDVTLLVLLCPMIPAPGETPGGWWASSGQLDARRASELRAGRDPDAPFDVVETFFHDVPDDVTKAALAGADGEATDAPFGETWALDAWPDVPTAVIAGAHDRLLPLDLVTRLSRERLGVEPHAVQAGHCAALAAPAELVERLEAARTATQARVPG
ncbi:MAG TPA: alpha/beta fold hydrolase [Solirubrobacteraceae bacterium]|nr:alpha/beta fold hydrolase [Solirubrobacteraceae bacterium]